MRILILGGDGMLGHQLMLWLQLRHEVYVTLRQDLSAYQKYGIFTPENSFCNIDMRLPELLTENVFTSFHPDVVINCIGIIKQRSDASESIPSLDLNALLPHRLSKICKAIDSRFIHFSTDCVFSGKKGNYVENDHSDAEDLYGQTKFLGEVYDSHCLTLRTSIIGRELSRKLSLLEWFLSQKESVKGFRKAVFSGFTTLEIGRIIENLLVNYPEASGLYHVSSDPINKYDLLNLFQKKFDLDITIEEDETFLCDRSLNSSKFRKDFNYTPPSWEKMIDELSKQTFIRSINKQKV